MKSLHVQVDRPKVLLLGVYNLAESSWLPEDYMEEFDSLVKTAGIEADAAMLVKVRSVSRAFYLSTGKLNEIANICHEHRFDIVICSVSLSPIQLRNMEDVTGCEVVDRAHLILDIFHKAAVTAEGKLQVEMAEAQMLKARMAGAGKEMGQQTFGVTARGPGEQLKEYDVRYYQNLVEKIKRKLAELKQSREVQRRSRLRSGLPMVSIVGYTNAGKSSLLNLLTKSSVLVEDKLFATLDITTRELFLAPEKKLLISDTVGFISQLPHHLIEAFRSTLEESCYATLLLHVIDISNSAWQEQAQVVTETLRDLENTRPVLNVFNKIDKLSPEQLRLLEPTLANYTPYVLIHTRSKDGVEPLRQAMIESKVLWQAK